MSREKEGIVWPPLGYSKQKVGNGVVYREQVLIQGHRKPLLQCMLGTHCTFMIIILLLTMLTRTAKVNIIILQMGKIQAEEVSK